MGDMKLLDDYSEIVSYNVSGLSVRSVRSVQADFPALSVVNHWHNDFEVAYVTKGKMTYSVNGERCEIGEGEMIFVNSGQMHFGFWERPCECEFICTIFHPTVLNENIAKKYLQKIVGPQSPAYILIKPESLQEKKMMECMRNIYLETTHRKEGFEFSVIQNVYEFCFLVMERIKNLHILADRAESKKLEAMHKMVGFIQQNYASKILLNDIAAVGLVCRSNCCEIFRHYLNKTPIEYLNEYRLSKSFELLLDPIISITEIAALCGFGSVSYFTETFHKLMGCTPTQYRNQQK